MKIASFCFAGFPGANQSLRNLSRTVRLSRHFSVTSLQPRSPELEFFAGHLAELRPALLILGAWTPAYKKILDALAPETTVAVYWTSSPGQVDMSQETALLAQALHHPRVRYVLFSSRMVAEALQARQNCLELPPTLPALSYARPRPANAVPVVSLFCSPNEYRRKNILTSLLAVGMQERALILYLNGLSGDKAYRELLGELGIQYHDWGWLNQAGYRRVLREVDIGLQVSFSESFGYVVTDHVLRGRPVLVSKMVPALQGLPARVAQRLVVENADDPFEFGNKLRYLLDHPGARTSAAQAARRHVLRENETNIEKARATLRQILEENRAQVHAQKRNRAPRD